MPNNRKLKRQNVTPDPELVQASELAGLRLYRLVDYIQQIEPELNRTEATYLTAAVLKFLPEVLGNNPLVIAQIRQQAQALKSQRNP